ncbi:hypothetical protein [Magnetovibrio sp.]|uniref:hypothetical protein n=1 Tax=Magnetovibrio sp. TaxID=2024836 RepID=UPI002F923028
MADIVDSLKSHARKLQRDVQHAHPRALARIRTLHELQHFDDTALPAHIRRRHCLTVIARELGFQGWGHAVHSLRDDTSFGRLLYPPRCNGHINIWCASYEEAQIVQAQHGGYLLAYQNQFLVVEDGYIKTLGLDPKDPDWRHIGYNWVEPRDLHARNRLYRKLVRASLRQ